jgi:hypothetical protein
MKGHLDADVLAEYRARLITGRRRRAITAHLSGCAGCAALDARLAQVSALLAAAPVPAMPDSVARRLDDALAGALATEAQKPISAERHSVPARHRRFPSLAGALRVRVLAPVAAAAAVLAWGGYVLGDLGGPSSSSGPASAAAGSARGAESEFGSAAGAATAGAATAGAGASFSPRRNAEAEPRGVYVVTSDVDYTKAALGTQVAGQLRMLSSLHATLGTSAMSACVLGVTGNAIPLLTEQAHYQGTPATVIVVSHNGADQVWVAGPKCTATDSDILRHVVLSPGISTP